MTLCHLFMRLKFQSTFMVFLYRFLAILERDQPWSYEKISLKIEIILLLWFMEIITAYRNGMMWGWVNNEEFFIFGWNMKLNWCFVSQLFFYCCLLMMNCLCYSISRLLWIKVQNLFYIKFSLTREALWIIRGIRKCIIVILLLLFLLLLLLFLLLLLIHIN